MTDAPVSEVENAGELGKGPLLQYSDKISKRYLDLYDAYVHYEMSNGVPMIASAAGHLKAEGLSTQEIIALQKPSQTFTTILDKLKRPFVARAEKLISDFSQFGNVTVEKRDNFTEMLRDRNSRKEYLASVDPKKITGVDKKLFDIAKEYDSVMNLYEQSVSKLFSRKDDMAYLLGSLPRACRQLIKKRFFVFLHTF